MRSTRGYGALSAQQVDPLSWFTGPLLPLVFAALNLVYGTTLAIVTWSVSTIPVIQLVGVALCSAACVVVHIMTRPLRQAIGWGTAFTATAIAGAGFVVSAVGYAQASFSIELWWAPFGLALAIASLAPYLSARRIVVVGLVVTVATVPFAYLAVERQVHYWGPVSALSIIASPIISAIIATAVFSYVVVSRMLPMIERRSSVVVTADLARDEHALQQERVRLTQLTARALPFIAAIGRTGVVTAGDRALAGQLARRLRDDLVTQSNLGWLDSVASESRLVVIDPERLAGRMRTPQRTALRALLTAILETPGTDSGSLLIELRRRVDGATAVGISLDMELPEGRRIMHLAPYYLALKTAARDLEWDDERFLRVSFNLPPAN